MKNYNVQMLMCNVKERIAAAIAFLFPNVEIISHFKSAPEYLPWNSSELGKV